MSLFSTPARHKMSHNNPGVVQALTLTTQDAEAGGSL